MVKKGTVVASGWWGQGLGMMKMFHISMRFGLHVCAFKTHEDIVKICAFHPM